MWAAERSGRSTCGKPMEQASLDVGYGKRYSMWAMERRGGAQEVGCGGGCCWELAGGKEAWKQAQHAQQQFLRRASGAGLPQVAVGLPEVGLLE